jgi:plastocyanin
VPHQHQDTRPPSAQDTVTQTAAGFEPRILPVVVGMKVRFRNEDQIYHSPFSVSPARSFDLEPQGPGESHSVTFDKVGVVNVYCELHSTENCFIIVVPDERFTRPNSRGEFSFTLLAAGDYTVTAWHPIHGETARRVNLSERGESNLKLSY